MNKLLQTSRQQRAPSRLRSALGCALMGAALASAAPAPAHAHRSDAASSISALSALPTLSVALSVATPVLLLAGGSTLVVKSVEMSAQGTVWVLERVGDGVQASVQLAGQLTQGLAQGSAQGSAQGLVLAVGTTVMVAAVSTGWVLYTGAKAVAFIPNELGKALTHNERVTR